MSLTDDLRSTVKQTFREQWRTREGRVVPTSDDLGLNNTAVQLEATVLYADLSGSTAMVDRFRPHFSAKVYKAYLHCAAKVIRARGGMITSYDGDRIMAVFIGKLKNSSAAKAALNINYVVKKVINPALKAQYPKTEYEVRQKVGIDTSELFVARTGVRGANDLVWVGRAANYAAKLAAYSPKYPSRITERVFKSLSDESRRANGKEMWSEARWTDMGDMTIYRSTYFWKP